MKTKFDGNRLSLYVAGFMNRKTKAQALEYARYQSEIDAEGKDFWLAVIALINKLY